MKQHVKYTWNDLFFPLRITEVKKNLIVISNFPFLFLKYCKNRVIIINHQVYWYTPSHRPPTDLPPAEPVHGYSPQSAKTVTHPLGVSNFFRTRLPWVLPWGWWQGEGIAAHKSKSCAGCACMVTTLCECVGVCVTRKRKQQLPYESTFFRVTIFFVLLYFFCVNDFFLMRV